jgi:hypothetical protein
VGVLEFACDVSFQELLQEPAPIAKGVLKVRVPRFTVGS